MSNRTKKKAIVIGTGIAGLAAAARLAIKGYEVNSYEANSYPGGKLTQIQLEGYRFDAGPSLLTMPFLIDEIFELAGEDPKKHFNYQRLDPICKYFYEDGTKLDAHADSQALAEEFEEKIGEPKENVLKHLAKSKEIYEITTPVFLESSLHKIGTYLNWHTIKSIFQIGKIKSNITMADYNARNFEKEKTVQFFNRFSTYNGSDAYQAPATLNVIPHLEFHMGAYFPDGGIYSISKSLYNFGKQLGVNYHFETAIQEIIVENKKAKAVKLPDGSIDRAEVIVSNMDVYATFKNLLPNEHHPNKVLEQEKSCSGIIFYFGIKKSFPDLDLHNIFFSKNSEEEFNTIFEHQKVYHDPTIYLNISAKIEKGDAPQGCENWFVLINAPNNSGQDWDSFLSEARKNTVAKLSRMLDEDIESLIVVEDYLDPRRIKSRTSSHLGALYGNSSNNKMGAFFRHPNFSKRIKNLYFCGGSVHPGGGMPLSLLSAKLVDEMISE